MEAELHWNGLRTALEKLVLDYGRFREAILKQRRALMEHRIEELLQVNHELEGIADTIFSMDARRRMHMEILSELAQSEVLQLDGLAGLWPQFDFAPLQTAAQQLRDVRADLEQVVRINTSLIESSRNLNQVMIEAMLRKPTNPQTPVQKVYGANGLMHTDARAQSRSLLNRRG